MFDRAFTVYADSGKGPGLLSLYGDENDGGPKLEIRLRQIGSMPAYDSGAARKHLAAELRTLGISRLDRENILADVRPNISLDQLTDGRLERLLALIDRAVT
ncbi:MAG: hypothetical protein ACRDRJ_04600 [Streptosporangiaceae bacterium]